jgi:hypothetical protein
MVSALRMLSRRHQSTFRRQCISSIRRGRTSQGIVILQTLEATPLEQAPGTIIYAPFATATTNGTGSFDDNPLGSCFGGLPPGTQVCQGYLAVSYEIIDGVTYPINTSTLRRDCLLGNSVTFQGNNLPFQNKVLSQGTVN